jgi:hypothetical protein
MPALHSATVCVPTADVALASTGGPEELPARRPSFPREWRRAALDMRRRARPRAHAGQRLRAHVSGAPRLLGTVFYFGAGTLTNS